MYRHSFKVKSSQIGNKQITEIIILKNTIKIPSHIIRDFYYLAQKEDVFKNLYSPEFRCTTEYIPSAWHQEFLPLDQLELSSPCNY